MKRKKIKNQIITVIMLGFMTFNIVPSETIEAIAETITDEDGQKEKKIRNNCDTSSCRL